MASPSQIQARTNVSCRSTIVRATSPAAAMSAPPAIAICPPHFCTRRVESGEGAEPPTAMPIVRPLIENVSDQPSGRDLGATRLARNACRAHPVSE